MHYRGCTLIGLFWWPIWNLVFVGALLVGARYKQTIRAVVNPELSTSYVKIEMEKIGVLYDCECIHTPVMIIQ